MIILTDIDDTLTEEGRLGPGAYQALWTLHSKGHSIIPVTGRPAGWCEMIARQWPVAGVVGENGAFYFSYHKGQMIRKTSPLAMAEPHFRQKLDLIKEQVLKAVPNATVASDQFCRLFDLAIDICEDIPRLSDEEIETILKIFKSAGATAKLSSIHINGWFGNFNKVDGSLMLLKDLFSIEPNEAAKSVYFIGDSPNDEPMWAFFQNSFAVANISEFLNSLTHKPKYIMTQPGGRGFVEFATKIVNS